MTTVLRRLVFTTHVTSSIGWVGAVIVFLALALLGQTSELTLVPKNQTGLEQEIAAANAGGRLHVEHVAPPAYAKFADGSARVDFTLPVDSGSAFAGFGMNSALVSEPDFQLQASWANSSAEIAWVQDRTVDAVDKVFSRAKQKIRRALGVESPTGNRRSSAATPHASDDRSLAQTDDPETDDGTS